MPYRHLTSHAHFTCYAVGASTVLTLNNLCPNSSGASPHLTLHNTYTHKIHVHMHRISRLPFFYTHICTDLITSDPCSQMTTRKRRSKLSLSRNMFRSTHPAFYILSASLSLWHWSPVMWNTWGSRSSWFFSPLKMCLWSHSPTSLHPFDKLLVSRFDNRPEWLQTSGWSFRMPSSVFYVYLNLRYNIMSHSPPSQPSSTRTSEVPISSGLLYCLSSVFRQIVIW